ncbi:MAG TPA: TlpA disulfide reductase family protein [Candidatus Lustribacter sp.]|jgi:thiol-disulfide isomerase/thioredoxin|nr:TlpA disulfide reductase family protein [Candidatus Lustribacter sp.]
MSKAAPQPAGWLNRKTLTYGTIAIVVIAAIIAIGLANRGAVSNSAQTVNPDATKLTVGSTAPTFNVTTDAGPFDLASVSTPVFLEVFASWCPHCQHEVPIIDALAKQYAGKVAFVGVSGSPYGVDGSSPENQADIDAWVQHLNVTYPVAFDPDLKVANAYLQGGYPTIVMIDRNKVVRYVNSGELTPVQLQTALNGVLSSHS